MPVVQSALPWPTPSAYTPNGDGSGCHWSASSHKRQRLRLRGLRQKSPADAPRIPAPPPSPRRRTIFTLEHLNHRPGVVATPEGSIHVHWGPVPTWVCLDRVTAVAVSFSHIVGTWNDQLPGCHRAAPPFVRKLRKVSSEPLESCDRYGPQPWLRATERSASSANSSVECVAFVTRWIRQGLDALLKLPLLSKYGMPRSVTLCTVLISSVIPASVTSRTRISCLPGRQSSASSLKPFYATRGSLSTETGLSPVAGKSGTLTSYTCYRQEGSPSHVRFACIRRHGEHARHRISAPCSRFPPMAPRRV